MNTTRRSILFALLASLASAARGADAPMDDTQLAALNSKFGLPSGHLQFVKAEGNLIAAQVKTEACTGKVFLQGAHVAAWQPPGEEPALLMSSKSAFSEGKAMRGGVPVIFPWFGSKADNPAAPGHGLVRTMTWQVESTREEKGNVIVVLKVQSDEKTKVYWPDDFAVREQVTFGKQLEIQLQTKNTGTRPTKCEEALHTYFAVKDIRQTKVSGFAGVDFIDKVDGKKHKTQTGNITFDGETDRVYLATSGPYVIVDGVLGRQISIEKTGSATSVVWNPGAAKVIADLGPGQWSQYVCVETANLAEEAVTINPGETHLISELVSIIR